MNMIRDEGFQEVGYSAFSRGSRHSVWQRVTSALLKWTRSRALAGAGLVLACGVSARATVWYVDNTATGANNGTSWANAWTSLSAVSGVKAGDTVYISGGTSSQTYAVSGAWSPAGGAAGNPIVYQTGQDAGHNGTVIFNMQGSAYWVNGGSNFKISGDVNGANHMVAYGASSSIVLDASGSGVQISHINITNVGGFKMDNASGVEIDNCTIYKTADPSGSLDYVFYGISGGAFDVNKVHNNRIFIPASSADSAYGDDGFKWSSGISIYSNHINVYVTSYPGSQHADVLQVNGNYIKVYANEFENAGESLFYHDAFDRARSITGIQFYNNVCYHSRPPASGVERGLDWQPEQNGTGSTFTDCFIANNTFVDFTTLFAIRWQNAASYTRCYVVNNVFYNCGTPMYQMSPPPSGMYIWYNKATGGGALSPANSAGPGGSGSVQFASYSQYSANNNFHLNVVDTGAADAGTNWPSAYFTTDKDGNPRPQGLNWDIGAYERGNATTNPTIAVSASVLNFPQTPINTTTNLTMTVQNIGAGTLAGNASVAAPFSIVSGAAYSLGANQSQTITVRFSPTVTGASSGTITFTGGGGKLVSVTGTGITPPPVVSAISQSGADIDATLPGLQVYAGSVIQYSGSASDPNGLPLTWQWVYSMNGAADVVFQSGSGTVAPISFNYTASMAGNTYVWKLRVSNGSSTSESSLTVGIEAPPPPAGTLTFAAGSGLITPPFVLSNGYISQSVMTGVTNGGQAVYNFTITNAGSYVVQVAVNAGDASANSLYLNIDGLPQDPGMIWDIPVTTGFEQRLASWRGNGTADADEFVPQIFTLGLGTHQLVVVGREPNVQLQSFSIVQIPPPPQNLHVVTAGP